MKKNKIKQKMINLWNWLKKECKDWKTFVIFICVVIIMYSPVWLGYLLYIIFKWKWCLFFASVTFAFWFGPCTPFFPLCIAITLSIKRIMQIKKKEENNNEG